MKLMIIESPGKIEKLSAILGDGWKIAASVGHVRDLPTKEIGVSAPDFQPMYVLTDRGAGVVAKLKALVKQADSVYLATDPDREGESISWHLEKCLSLKNPLRVTFNEITANAVQAALAAPRSIDIKRVEAQEARRVLDRLVGYMVSPVLSQRTGERLSAGRVQSPAVRLVVERERAIKAFQVTNHFGAALYFAGDKGEWSAEWMTKPNFVTDENPYFLNKVFAESISKIEFVTVTAFEEGQAKRSPPPPFTTSTMQQAASVALNLNPKAAMDAAQKLYEQGHITYHRTDNPNVSEDSMGNIQVIAAKLGLDMAESQRKFKAPAGAQVGHPAITPTHWGVDEAGETEDQRALYKLIRLRAIACQLADARYAVRTVRLGAVPPVDVNKAIEFEATGRTLVYPGWLKLIAGDQTEEDEDKAPSNPIPVCTTGQRLDVVRGKLLEKKTKAPSRFTQATLVKKLESEGIGRPATYAAIMDNITSRGYVQTEKKFLIPTASGELVVDSLADKFDFMDLGFTRNIEEDLDRIAEGKAQYLEVVKQLHEKLQAELSALQGTAAAASQHACPSCGRPMRRISSKAGAFWGCTGRPDCSLTLPDDNGKPGQRKAQELSNFACPKCGKPLVHRIKTGAGAYDFWGCSGFKDGCKTSFSDLNGKPNFDKSKN